MPVIYELRDELVTPLSWHPTRKDAEREQREWEKMGAETVIVSHRYESTKAGVAHLLNRVAKDP